MITDIENEIIEHTVDTFYESCGSPLIKRYNNNLVLGIHFDYKKKLAIPFDLIIKDIKNKLSYHVQKINLIYDISLCDSIYETIPISIFGKEFVENNKDDIKLIIDNKQLPLIEKYYLKKGQNKIQMIILNKLTNLENMFLKCKSLINIEELKYLDVQEVNNFSRIFCNCKHLTNINAL